MNKKDIPGLDKLWILGKNSAVAIFIVSGILQVAPADKYRVILTIVLLSLVFSTNEVNEERLSLRIKELEYKTKGMKS